MGKWIMGLRVVKLDGQPYGWWSVIGRNIIRVIDGLPVLYLVGIIVVALSLNKQRLGDMVAGTSVVRAAPGLRERSYPVSQLGMEPAEPLPIPVSRESLISRMTLAMLVIVIVSGVSIALSPRNGDEVKVPAGVKIPTEATLQFLATKSFLDLDQAIRANDFRTFHSSIAEIWKNETTVQELSKAFQDAVNARVRLQGVTEVLPIFDRRPTFDENGVLVLSGHYPMSPLSLDFQLGYVYDAPEWKLVGISFNLRR